MCFTLLLDCLDSILQAKEKTPLKCSSRSQGLYMAFLQSWDSLRQEIWCSECLQTTTRPCGFMWFSQLLHSTSDLEQRKKVQCRLYSAYISSPYIRQLGGQVRGGV